GRAGGLRHQRQDEPAAARGRRPRRDDCRHRRRERRRHRDRSCATSLRREARRVRPGAVRHHRPRNGGVAVLRSAGARGRHLDRAPRGAAVDQPGADHARCGRFAFGGRAGRHLGAGPGPAGHRIGGADALEIEEHTVRRLAPARRRRRDHRRRPDRLSERRRRNRLVDGARRLSRAKQMDKRAELRDKALKDLQQSGVLMLDGHFDYGNGYHGRVYLNPHDSTTRADEDGEQRVVVEVKGVDVYDPTTGQIRSSSTDDIACWFIDTDFNGESFFVRHAYFTGGAEPCEKLKRALRAEIDEGAWATLYSTVSRPFAPPETDKIA